MRILIIEDEHKIANSLKKGLEQETFTVDVAYDGTDGYDLAVTEDYDLIILDQMLPGISGLEICQNLRRQKIHTPILILTAKGETKDKVSGLNAGADDYLTKPFVFEELLARIRALVRRPKQRSENKLFFVDLTVDIQNREVKIKNRPVQLSVKEFSILEYLVKNKNRIINKEELISHIWNYDSDILPNTVEVFINSLRKKLGVPNLIKTIRGFGYKIGK